MNTVLIVEDEIILREVIKDYLINEGYQVLEAGDGQEALDLFKNEIIHLMILDIMLPKIDGWSVCRRVRQTSNVPIIMLTARGDEDDSLLGYELGADDYLIKPYSPRVLVAKAKRILDRSRVLNRVSSTLSICGINADLSKRVVSIDGELINLTHTEFEILIYLMQNKDIVISREQLISKVWGYDFIGDEKTVNSHIRNLRSKLGDKSKCITTIIRSGYKFEGCL